MKKVFLLIALLGVSFCGVASATTWDVNTDMDASIGDNGIWSYGYAEFDPSDPNKVAYQGLMDDGGASGGTNNIWVKNVDGAGPHIFVGPLVSVPAGMHGMKGGVKSLGGDVPAVIRWTAPAALVTPTDVTMDAWFLPYQGGTVEIIIVKSVAGDPNQQTFLLDQKDVTLANGVQFNTVCAVTAGDTIDFMVSLQGEDNGDWVGLAINITDTPEDRFSAPWVLNTDMNAGVNDNGLWSYGYGEPNSIEAGLIDDVRVVGGERFVWIEDTHGSPHIWKGPLVSVPAGMHGVHPGAGVPVRIRWTAPAQIVTPTSIVIEASFQPTSTGLVDIKVVKSVAGDVNQTTNLDKKLGVSNAEPFLSATECTVTAGDTIDCVVGPAGEAVNDWTATSITISEGFLTCVTYLPMDFTQDCYVDLADFAIFAQSWLDCNNAFDPACQ